MIHSTLRSALRANLALVRWDILAVFAAQPMPVDVSPRPDRNQTEYMGDGVYATFDGFQIWLTTQQGDRIALEPSVYNAVRAYGAMIWELKP